MSNSNIGSKGWITGLDTIRFVLAIVVLLGHANVFGPLENINNDSLLFRLCKLFVSNSFVGITAVIAFFVISGLVIHYPYRNGKKINLPEYFVKRYLRVGIPMIIVAIMAYWLKVDPSDLPFWSLYCELIYYTLYPLVLWIMAKYKWSIENVITGAFIISYLFLFIHGQDVVAFLTQSKSRALSYHYMGIYWTWLLGFPCWLLGVRIAAKYDEIKADAISEKRILWIRLVTFGSSVFCSIAHFHLSLSYTISMGLFSLLASFWILNEIKYWSNRKSISFLENGGKWSYSLYLCHMFPIAYVRYHGGTTHFLIAFAQVVSALIISYVFYLLIEKPSHSLLRKIKFSANTPDYKVKV